MQPGCGSGGGKKYLNLEDWATKSIADEMDTSRREGSGLCVWLGSRATYRKGMTRGASVKVER